MPRPTARLKPRGRPRHADYVPDKAFQGFVRGHPCLLHEKETHISGRVEFAHLKSRGSGGKDAGNGVPLCGMAHRRSPLSLHMLAEEDFEKVWGLKRGTLRARAADLWRIYQREETR